MATKEDYSKMTSKKLKGLVNIVSAEDAAVINEILASREQVKEVADEEAPTSEETQATGEEAPKKEKTASEKPEKPKMSDEECAELVKKLTAEMVGHKCTVVPFNTAEWKDGIITNIINDKRTNKPLIGIKIVEDSRRIVKAYDSTLVKVSEELADMSKSPRTGSRVKKEVTEEDLQRELTEAGQHVGKEIQFKEFKSDVISKGIIMTVYIDKRSERVILRVKKADGTLAHKTFGAETLDFTGEVDQKIMDAYAEAEAIRIEIAKSPEKRMEVAKKALDSAEAELVRLTKVVDARKAEFDAAVAAVKEAAENEEA